MTTPSSQPILLVAEVTEGRMLRRALEAGGHPVLHRPTGIDAADWLDRGPLRPSMIVIDWNVRGGDSARFLARQAADPRLAAVPVVVVAAIPHMRHVSGLCVLATLAKPVRGRTLVEVIDRLLGRRPSNDASGDARTSGRDRNGWRVRRLGSEPVSLLAPGDVPEPLDDGPDGTPRTIAMRAARASDATVRMRALDDDLAPARVSDRPTAPTAPSAAVAVRW